MLTFTRESTHFYIISNIWIATAVLATHAHDVWFAGVMGMVWFVYALLVSRKERQAEG